MISRINVVYLYVRDMERSRAFYRDVLGLSLEGDDHWAEMTFGDGVRFALHAAHGEARPGTVVVDFEVADIDAAVAHVRELGVEVGEITRQEYGCFAELTDPDGYVLELFQPPTGAD